VNFVGVNRAGPRRGSISAKDIAVMIAGLKGKKSESINKPHCAPVSTLTHLVSGKASAPPIRISEVIENKFGNEGQKAAIGRYEEYLSRRIENSKIKMTVKPTKASRGHNTTSVCATETKEPFKLSKFKNIPARVYF